MKDATNPMHYRTHPSGVEQISITEAWDFCTGNAFKYLFRCGQKGDALDDLRKALWYVDRAIEVRQKILFPWFTGETCWNLFVDGSQRESFVMMAESRFAGHMASAMASLMQAAACPRGCKGLQAAKRSIKKMIEML